jgi:hypothetical protein
LGLKASLTSIQRLLTTPMKIARKSCFSHGNYMSAGGG